MIWKGESSTGQSSECRLKDKKVPFPKRPVKAKALKKQAINKAFALTGRLVDCYYTQGGALG